MESEGGICLTWGNHWENVEDIGLGRSGWVSGLQSWHSVVEPGEAERDILMTQ